MVEKNFLIIYNFCRIINQNKGCSDGEVSMEKEENVEKTNKVEEVKNEEVKNEKVEELKFSKVTGKDLKKEKDMDKIENKKKKNKAKSDKKQDKEKGNNKVGIWVGGIVLLLIVLAIVAALIILPQTPEKTVEGMLNSLKNGDFESVNKYVNSSDLLQNSEMDEEAQTLLFNELSWKILNISKEENTAKVEVEITNKDFNQVISNYTQEALKIAFSGESFTEEQQANELKEQLKNEDIGTRTVTATVNLVKQDGEWKVQVDENLENSLLPGLQEAMDSLNEIING